MAVALLAAFLVGGSAVPAQQREPTPATLPAEALAFADELEKETPEKLLDWARKRARELLRDDFKADELSEESIAKLFPAEPAQVRQAIRFLVGYEVYRRTSDRQKTRASVVYDIDREIRDLNHRLQTLEATPALIGSRAEAERDLAIAVGQDRMELLQVQRKSAVRNAEGERQRVDTSLRWLAEAHGRVKDVAPDVLRTVRPPRH